MRAFTVLLWLLAACSAAAPIAVPPLPSPAPPPPLDLNRYPAELASVLLELGEWKHYRARGIALAGDEVVSRFEVDGVPGERKLSLRVQQDQGPRTRLHTVTCDGQVGVGRTETRFADEVGLRERLAYAVGTTFGLLDARVDQRLLGTDARPCAGLGDSSVLEPGQDLPGALRTLLDAGAWDEVDGLEFDGEPCRVFASRDDAGSAFDALWRSQSGLLLGARGGPAAPGRGPPPGLVNQRRLVALAGTRIKAFAIAANPPRVVRLLELDTSEPPPPERFAVDDRRSEDRSLQAAEGLRPLRALLADPERLASLRRAYVEHAPAAGRQPPFHTDFGASRVKVRRLVANGVPAVEVWSLLAAAKPALEACWVPQSEPGDSVEFVLHFGMYGVLTATETNSSRTAVVPACLKKVLAGMRFGRRLDELGAGLDLATVELERAL